MKHTKSILVILLFIGLSYFIFPHRLFPQTVPKSSAIHITPIVKKFTRIVSPSPTHSVGVAGASTTATAHPSY